MCGIGPGRTACPSGGNRCPFSFPFIFHKATTHNEENNEDNREPHPTGRQHGEKKKRKARWWLLTVSTAHAALFHPEQLP